MRKRSGRKHKAPPRTQSDSVTHRLDVGQTSRLFLTGLYLGLLIFYIGLWLEPTKANRINKYSNISLVIPLLGALFGLRRLTSAPQTLFHRFLRAPLLFCIGLLSWSLGSVVWMYYNFKWHVEMPYPSWADAGYFPCLLLWSVGIVFLYERTKANILNNLYSVSTMLVSICGGTVAVMIWAHSGRLSPYSPTKEIFKFTLDVAYPFVDSINMALLGALLLGPRFKQLPLQMRKALSLISLGYLFLWLADLSFNVLSSFPDGSSLSYFNGGPTDFMFVSAFYVLSIGMSFIPLDS